MKKTTILLEWSTDFVKVSIGAYISDTLRGDIILSSTLVDVSERRGNTPKKIKSL